MEGFGVLAGLVVLGLFIVLPIWVIASIVQLRREIENDRRDHRRISQDLTARLSVLEKHFQDAKRDATPGHDSGHDRAHNVIPDTARHVERDIKHEVKHETRDIAPAIKIPPNAPATIASPRPPTPPVPEVKAPETIRPHADHEPASPPPPRAPERPTPPPTLAPPRMPQPVFKPAEHQPAEKQPPAPERVSLEEMLGTNWLNKIGISILVLGLAFFLAYQLQNLGPAGKVLLGIALSAVMIAVGVRYESNDRYRILARASAAGGWALLYFVSYAIYHVSATHLIDSRTLDLLLMLAVAAAIVWYSLRYRSQATTALALTLSYLTVGIHHTSFYSLAASVLLAVTVVVLALRMNWFALELLAILATYFNHLLWLWPVVESLGPRRAEFPEYHTSILLLVFYWLLFRFSYIYRNVANSDQERFSAASALANGFCLLAVFKYQSVHPEWTFSALLLLGAMELGLSALAARRRRPAFIVLATIGSVLLVAAIPFRYSGSNLSLLWLAAAEAFLLLGVFLGEIVFRRIGLITLFVVGGQMLFVTGAPLLQLRLFNAPNALPAYADAVLFATAAALCYFNSHWLRVRWPKLFEPEFDSSLASNLTYLGCVLLLVAAWFAWPGMWTAVAWAVLALLLNFAAKQMDEPPLALQGNVVAVAGIIRLITLNLFSGEQWHGVSLRLLTVGITAVLLYAAAPFARGADDDTQGWIAAAYTWAASILLGLLMWYEMSGFDVALGWMALGLVLLEIGLQLKAGFLRQQGYTALAASFFQLFIADLNLLDLNQQNLNLPPRGGSLDTTMTRALPLAASYFYADWRLRLARRYMRESDLDTASSFLSYFGVIALASVLYFELSPSWIAAGWAALALAMVAASMLAKRLDYLRQSFLIGAAAAFRALTYNFLLPSFPGSPFLRSQQYYIGVAIALLFAALPLAFQIRKSEFITAASNFPLDRRPEQFFFFVPFGLLTSLIGLESTHGRLTINLGMEGLAVFFLAIFVGERSFRLSGLGLLMLCVAKIFLIDVWGLDPQLRYITLIVLGAALLFVSFLYTGHKEKFQRYL